MESWGNHGGILGESWGNRGGIMGELCGNHGGIISAIFSIFYHLFHFSTIFAVFPPYWPFPTILPFFGAFWSYFYYCRLGLRTICLRSKYWILMKSLLDKTSIRTKRRIAYKEVSKFVSFALWSFAAFKRHLGRFQAGSISQSGKFNQVLSEI